MGMHLGLIAARTTVSDFLNAFSAAWPAYDVVAANDALVGGDALWAWKEQQEKPTAATGRSSDDPGREVYLFWQDGPWALMADDRYLLASDEEGLQRLSASLGIMPSFVVENAAGCAAFMRFDDGALQRRIEYMDGDLSTFGEPCAEVAGLDLSRFHMQEVEALAAALGMTALGVIPEGVAGRALCVVNGADRR